VPLDKHRRQRFDRYIAIHETVMSQFRDQGFVRGDTLAIEDLGSGVIGITGRIECAEGTYIAVEKLLAIADGEGATALVETVAYSYSAVLARVGNIFRYCSPHDDHNEDHHVHRFDVRAGDMSGTLTFHGRGGWPTLGEVIEELRGWVADNAEWLHARGA
jgi:hypothetical protein